MKTTIVVWSIGTDKTQDYWDASKLKMDAKAAEIAGSEPQLNNLIDKTWSIAEGTVTFKRTWSTAESAEAWVSWCLAEGAISAVVDPT